jgi:hypothetical protein
MEGQGDLLDEDVYERDRVEEEEGEAEDVEDAESVARGDELPVGLGIADLLL